MSGRSYWRVMSYKTLSCFVCTIAMILAGCAAGLLGIRPQVLAKNEDLQISVVQGDARSDSIVVQFSNQSNRNILINTHGLLYTYRGSIQITAGQRCIPQYWCIPQITGQMTLLVPPKTTLCRKYRLWPEHSNWYQVFKKHILACLVMDSKDSVKMSDSLIPWIGYGRSCVSYFIGTDAQPLNYSTSEFRDMSWFCVPCSTLDSSMGIKAKSIYVPGDGPIDQEKILRSSE